MTALIVLLAGSALGLDEAKLSERIFADCERSLKNASSLSGKLYGTETNTGTHQTTFLFQKPRSFRVINGSVNIYCNGRVQFNHLVEERQYFSRDVSQEHSADHFVYSLDGFFGRRTGDTAPYFVNSTEYRMQEADGRRCAAKALHFESFGRDDRMVFFVDAETRRPVGWDQVFGFRKMHWRLIDLRYNVQVPKGAFDWKPAPDLTEKKIRSRPHHP